MHILRNIRSWRLIWSLSILFTSGVYGQRSPVLWFAHRGFRGLYPENTIEAMKQALNYQSVILEMDLAITKDREVVISHNPVLNYKITRDPTGKSLPQDQKIRIYQVSYEQLQQYDVGTKPNSEFPKQIRYSASIPRFTDLIDSIENYVTRMGIKKPMYFIETKLKPQTDGINHPDPQEFVTLMMHIINRKGIEDRVIIQSFDPRTLQIVHTQYPQIPLTFLTRAGTTMEENLEKLGFTPEYYGLKPESVTKAFMKKCRAYNISPIVGVLNDYCEFLRLKKLGVNGFISDYPIEYLKEKK